ncbi:hypothetical protein pb186bvf_019851 [Paramecium bursaria]
MKNLQNQENDSQFLDMRENLKNLDFGEQITEIQGGHKLAFVNIQQFNQVQLFIFINFKVISTIQRTSAQVFKQTIVVIISQIRLQKTQFRSCKQESRLFSRSCMNIWATPDYEECPIKTFADEKFLILLYTLSIHERNTIYKITEQQKLKSL